MPKQQKKAISVQNITHPKSRKAIKVFKESKKHAAREKSKMVTYVKQNVLGEKMLWFKEHLPPNDPVCSKECADELIQKYLARFDEELEQIRLKHAIGQRKNRQHASREDLIRHTREREREEYNTCGLELPNLLDPLQVKMLREWSGELRFIQNFTLCRLGRKHLLPSSSEERVPPHTDGVSSTTPEVLHNTEITQHKTVETKQAQNSACSTNLKEVELSKDSEMLVDS